MIYADTQGVVTVFQVVSDIQCPDGTPHEFLGILMTVEGDGGIGADAFELEEVATTILLRGGENLVVYGTAVQIAVTQLAIAMIVIEVVGDVNHRHFTALDTCQPAFIERGHGAAAFALRGGETDLAASHRYAGGNGNATLLVVVDSAVEVVDHSIVLHHVALVGKHLVVGLRGDNQVRARPVLPMQQVTADGEGVIGVIFAVGIIGREIEHDEQVAHLHNLGIARDDARSLVEVDRIAVVSFPILQVVAQGNADALSLEMVLGIDATSVVEHEEAVLAQCRWQVILGFAVLAFLFSFLQGLWLQVVDGALVLGQLLPPLHIVVVDAEQGLVLRLPLVGLGDGASGPCQSDVQRLAHGLIARAVTSDVGHPVVLPIL